MDIPSSGAIIHRLVSAATTNATLVKAAPGRVLNFYCSNTGAVLRFVKFYNKASAPTVGTDTPVLTFAIQSMAALGTPVAVSISLSELGAYFSTGISYAITSGQADSDTGAIGAGECVLNLFYL